jgi:hypothetical protein
MKRKFKEDMKTIASYIAEVGLGGFAGYVYSFYERKSAEASVKVRLELENVSLWEAFLVDHLENWLWYHYGKELTITSVIV